MTRKQKRKPLESMHIRKTCKEKLKNYTGVKLCPTCGSKVAVVVGKTNKCFVPIEKVGG